MNDMTHNFVEKIWSLTLCVLTQGGKGKDDIFSYSPPLLLFAFYNVSFENVHIF